MIINFKFHQSYIVNTSIDAKNIVHLSFPLCWKSGGCVQEELASRSQQKLKVYSREMQW